MTEIREITVDCLLCRYCWQSYDHLAYECRKPANRRDGRCDDGPRRT